MFALVPYSTKFLGLSGCWMFSDSAAADALKFMPRDGSLTVTLTCHNATFEPEICVIHRILPHVIKVKLHIATRNNQIGEQKGATRMKTQGLRKT
jgi:hypothetical protein